MPFFTAPFRAVALLFVLALALVACADTPLPAEGALRAANAAPAATRAPMITLVPSFTATVLPPTSTVAPTLTATPTAAPLPTATPTPTATPVLLNGIDLSQVIVLPDGVRQHIVQIAARGRALGRDPKAFSRIGGSVAATPHFMGRFDTGPYDLGPYAELQPTIDFYAGSFSRVGQAAMRGFTAWAVFDPAWASHDVCLANEAAVDCEIRLHNPSLAFVVLGTNDIGKVSDFEANLHKLLSDLIEQGIVPILATKSDRFEGLDDRNNTVIRQLAADLQLPLWDFDRIAGTIPGRGMGSDNVHLTLYDQYDYTVERAFQRGYGVYNLTALMMLDVIRQELNP